MLATKQNKKGKNRWREKKKIIIMLLVSGEEENCQDFYVARVGQKWSTEKFANKFL